MTQESGSSTFRRSLAILFVALVACALYTAAPCAAVAATNIDWRDAAADPHGNWAVMSGVDSLGEAVVITSVATSSATSARFVTSYIRGGTHLVVQREANADGTFTVTYSAGRARLTLAATASPASSPAQVDVVVESDRSDRLTILDSRVGIADYSASRARLRQVPNRDSRALLEAIESYLADTHATSLAIPKFGDSIVGGLLERSEAPIGPGPTSNAIRKYASCRDECAAGCGEQCTFECTFGRTVCQICNTACGIGCAIGCGA